MYLAQVMCLDAGFGKGCCNGLVVLRVCFRMVRSFCADLVVMSSSFISLPKFVELRDLCPPLGMLRWVGSFGFYGEGEQVFQVI